MNDIFLKNPQEGDYYKTFPPTTANMENMLEAMANSIVARLQKPNPAMKSAEPGTITCFCGQTTRLHNDTFCEHGVAADFKCGCGREWKLFWLERKESK